MILSYFLSSWCFILIWQVKLVKCIVQNIVVDISFNQIGGLCTLCFLEQVGIFWNLILFYILGSGRWTVETSTPYLVDCVILLNVQVLKDSWCNLEKSGLNGCWRTWGWINWLIWSVIINYNCIIPSYVAGYGPWCTKLTCTGILFYPPRLPNSSKIF